MVPPKKGPGFPSTNIVGVSVRHSFAFCPSAHVPVYSFFIHSMDTSQKKIQGQPQSALAPMSFVLLLRWSQRQASPYAFHGLSVITHLHKNPGSKRMSTPCPDAPKTVARCCTCFAAKAGLVRCTGSPCTNTRVGWCSRRSQGQTACFTWE